MEMEGFDCLSSSDCSRSGSQGGDDDAHRQTARDAMTAWQVSVVQLSGLNTQITLWPHDCNSKICSTVQKRWGIPDRCQQLAWGGHILSKQDYCNFGKEKVHTVNLVLDLRLETLLGTNQKWEWQEAADMVAAWACRDSKAASLLLRDLQDHFIASAIDCQRNVALAGDVSTAELTWREAALRILNKEACLLLGRGARRVHVAFSCPDADDGEAENKRRISFHYRPHCKHSPGHSVYMIMTMEAQQGFRLLQPAEACHRVMHEVQEAGVESTTALQRLNDRDLDEELFYAVVVLLRTHSPAWADGTWNTPRRSLGELDLRHEPRVLKLFFEGRFAQQEDLPLAEARLAMHPVEPRGVAAKIIRIHGRQGHPRTVKALIDCMDEQQHGVAPTIPRTLGLIATPGDQSAAVALRRCLHSVKKAVPAPGLGESALQHWHGVQTSLWKQLLAALERLGEDPTTRAVLPLVRVPTSTEWRAGMEEEEDWTPIETMTDQ